MTRPGPPPKPTAVKILEGNPGQRKLHDDVEPQPEKIEHDIEPPEHLTEISKAEWRRLLPELRLCGLLTVADLPAFTIYCALWGRWVAAETAMNEPDANGKREAMVIAPGGTPMANPRIGISNRAAELMLRYIQQFGMTPSSRARMGSDLGSVPKPRDDAAGDEAPALPTVEAGELTGLIGRN